LCAFSTAAQQLLQHWVPIVHDHILQVDSLVEVMGAIRNCAAP
jgi:hypothetical protein